MSRGRLVEFTVAAEELLTLFFAPTKDSGLTVGFTHPSFGGAKLTSYLSPRDGRIHTHLKDARSRRLLWSSQIDPGFLGQVLARRYARWTLPTEEVPFVYVAKSALGRKLNRFLPRVADERRTQVPAELFRVRIRMDVRNQSRWRRVPIAAFLRDQPPWGFTIIRGTPKRVMPILNSSTHVLAFSERQHHRVQSILERLIGVEALLEHVESARLGGPVFKKGRRRVREVYGVPAARRKTRLPV